MEVPLDLVVLSHRNSPPLHVSGGAAAEPAADRGEGGNGNRTACTAEVLAATFAAVAPVPPNARGATRSSGAAGGVDDEGGALAEGGVHGGGGGGVLGGHDSSGGGGAGGAVSGLHAATASAATAAGAGAVKLWIYVPDDAQVATATEEYPLVQTYLDVVMEGCIEMGGAAMASDFVLGT